MTDLDDLPDAVALLNKIKSALPELETLLDDCTGHCVCQDGIYRFYHQSFKVFGLQSHTLKMIEKTPRALS